VSTGELPPRVRSLGAAPGCLLFLPISVGPHVGPCDHAGAVVHPSLQMSLMLVHPFLAQILIGPFLNTVSNELVNDKHFEMERV
jgi:hypothetical protein